MTADTANDKAKKTPATPASKPAAKARRTTAAPKPKASTKPAAAAPKQNRAPAKPQAFARRRVWPD